MIQTNTAPVFSAEEVCNVEENINFYSLRICSTLPKW